MIMNARFPGSCKTCSGEIKIGDRIDWVKGRGAMHADPSICQLVKAAGLPPAPEGKPPGTFFTAAPPKTIDLSSIVTFLKAAQERGLKFPTVRFLGPDGRTELRLRLGGQSSKSPDVVQVKLGGGWIGSVLPSGACIGPIFHHVHEATRSVLLKIAEDPAAAAKEYGALTCRCSFCNLPLTDAGSVKVGYGPICAMNYGLPHSPEGTPELKPLTPHAEIPITNAQGITGRMDVVPASPPEQREVYRASEFDLTEFPDVLQLLGVIYQKVREDPLCVDYDGPNEKIRIRVTE